MSFVVRGMPQQKIAAIDSDRTNQISQRPQQTLSRNFCQNALPGFFSVHRDLLFFGTRSPVAGGVDPGRFRPRSVLRPGTAWGYGSANAAKLTQAFNYL